MENFPISQYVIKQSKSIQQLKCRDNEKWVIAQIERTKNWTNKVIQQWKQAQANRTINPIWK